MSGPSPLDRLQLQSNCSPSRDDRAGQLRLGIGRTVGTLQARAIAAPGGKNVVTLCAVDISADTGEGFRYLADLGHADGGGNPAWLPVPPVAWEPLGPSSTSVGRLLYAAPLPPVRNGSSADPFGLLAGAPAETSQGLLIVAPDGPAWEAGLAFLPLALMVGVAGKLGSGLVSHAGIRPVLLLGLALEGSGALLLAHEPAAANYFANVLPGFLRIGFGLGLAFVAVPLVVMADVSDADTGMVSGMVQTAHEIGISLGVAALSAVATAGAAEAGFEVGFRHALFAAALFAGVIVVASLVAVPDIRPVDTPRSQSPSATPGSAPV